MTASPSAQQHLAAAKALFPGRYSIQFDKPYYVGFDHFRERNVAVERDEVSAARKTLTSARISQNNGRRRYGEQDDRRPETRFLKLPKAQWSLLEQFARQQQLSLEQLLLSLLPESGAASRPPDR